MPTVAETHRLSEPPETGKAIFGVSTVSYYLGFGCFRSTDLLG